MKEYSDIKAEGADGVHSGRNKGLGEYKKQGGTTGDDFFRGISFRAGKEGRELYAKTIGRLGLYGSTKFKNNEAHSAWTCQKSFCT